MNTISWASETQSNPMEINPRTAFERMFGRPGTPAEREARIREDRSILDSVTEEARDLQRKVGARDRTRIGDYLDHVREIERRIQKTEAQNAKQVLSLDAPLGVPDTFEAHAAMMFDLMAVAYQSDITRVFSFMMSREASQRTYPSSTSRRPTTTCRTTVATPTTWSATRSQHALRAALRDVPREAEVDARRRRHSARPLADLLRRRHERRSSSRAVSPPARRGRTRWGRHQRRPFHSSRRSGRPIANLWLGVANLYGIRLDRFAESNGRVEI
jgi:hypothetical protein